MEKNEWLHVGEEAEGLWNVSSNIRLKGSNFEAQHIL